jgi:hypothetical protein
MVQRIVAKLTRAADVKAEADRSAAVLVERRLGIDQLFAADDGGCIQQIEGAGRIYAW